MILVTGGSGLVGKELITRLLAQGKKVRVIYNKTPLPDFGSDNLQKLQCNILDVDGLSLAMQDVQYIYHCAAIVSFNPKKKHELFKINVEGTANIVNAAIDAGVKKLVFVSSVSALARKNNEEIINEKMFWLERFGKSDYGMTKYLAEIEVWRGIGEGLEAVIVSPSIILGAGNWETGSSKFFKTVFDEFPWYSDGINGFVDVRDVAKAMTALMESEISGERFILSAQTMCYKDIFSLIAKSFKKRIPYKKVTPLMAKVAWRLESIKSIFTGKEPLVTKETAATALATFEYDNSKLFQFIPDFKYLPIEQTINDTCNFLSKKYNV